MRKYRNPQIHQSIVQMPAKPTPTATSSPNPGARRSGIPTEHAQDRLLGDGDRRLTLDVLDTIRQHRGSENAITLKQIAELHSINWRKAAAILAELRHTKNPICTNRSKPKGVYWVETREEAQATLARFDALIRDLAAERNTLAKSFESVFAIPYQRPMF